MCTTSASTAPAADRLARADLCRFVAACYYEPGPEFAEERLLESLAAVAERVDPALGEQARRLALAFSVESPEALLVDYTRLFLGPSDAYARPYGSVWMADARDDVAAAYAAAGFEVDGVFGDRPDHVAVELEFLYRLVHEGSENSRDGFVTQHLGRWVPPFAAAVEAAAHTAFYRELARLTERIVRREASVM